VITKQHPLSVALDNSSVEDNNMNKKYHGTLILTAKRYLCLSLKKGTLCCQDDAIEPEEHHPAVPQDDGEKIDSFIVQGLPFEEALLQLRRTHFPVNYEPHPWKTGKSTM